MLLVGLIAACTQTAEPARQAGPAAARNVLLITIDTLRADHVGAYGYTAATTPALDGVARRGARFDRAYATAPITLTSHASLLTGRYPQGHGARHNGMRLDLQTPTLAEALARAGAATAAFVGAFPLDRRFGLIKGFQAYGDAMPRQADGRLANERPGRVVVDEATAWLTANANKAFFLWVHLFEPHAPYGNPQDARRPVGTRYDEDVTEADRQVARLLAAAASREHETLTVIAGDHGEAFGEHGEIAHSVFTYDTTLRVPLLIAGPGVRAGVVVSEPVSLVDIAPTILRRLGLPATEMDGVDLTPSLDGRTLPDRPLYAESFAPLLDFGWSPLRTIRAAGWKYIAAPKPELYDLEHDPSESQNLVARETNRAAQLAKRVDAISPVQLTIAPAQTDPEALARLQALGYASGRPAPETARADPKDKRALAARIAQVTSGELAGAALEGALREILREDPANPQANVRLGYVLLGSGRCAEATRRFTAAIAAHLPSVDAHLGLANCQVTQRNTAGAIKTLSDAARVEPGNPVVEANLGLILSDSGKPLDGIPHLQRALTLEPDLHQARFALAIAYARSGNARAATREAEELLSRVPADAPQRPEIERLITTLKNSTR